MAEALMKWNKRALAIALLCSYAYAHPHHEKPSEEAEKAPIDSILWIHIGVQALVWGVLFPIGMVLGMARSRWHVPLQSTGFLLTLGGYVLGHKHKGRMFPPTAHGAFANIIFVPILLQLVLGIYLKLHIHEKSIRPYAVKAHGVVGKAYPVIGWVQMLFGAIALQGYCRGTHLGQCLAHYIMGSGFIAYGTIMAIIFLVGESWMRRSGKSPEFWDSCVITAWGIVNTFTEHRGSVWSVKDMQHTILGVLWWTGGILGIFLSRNNQRNVVPALIIILTGWAMSSHAQALPLSTMVHGMFGKTLMLAGLARLIEVCYFAPKLGTPSQDSELTSPADDASEHTLAEHHHLSARGVRPSRVAGAVAWRHLTPFLLVASGLLFMSATDEELEFVDGIDMDHVTYILIMISMAFLIYAFIVFLIHLYSTSGRNAASSLRIEDAMEYELQPSEGAAAPKWYARVPGVARGSESRAHEPLHVIGSDDEEDDHHVDR